MAVAGGEDDGGGDGDEVAGGLAAVGVVGEGGDGLGEDGAVEGGVGVVGAVEDLVVGAGVELGDGGLGVGHFGVEGLGAGGEDGDCEGADVGGDVSGGADLVVSAAEEQGEGAEGGEGEPEAAQGSVEQGIAARGLGWIAGLGGLAAHRLTLLSHSGEVLKVGVFKVFRIFQPEAEEAVEGDMTGPDDGEGFEERAVGLEGDEKEKDGQEEVVGKVVGGCSDARVGEVAEHEEVWSEEEEGEEEPAEMVVLVEQDRGEQESGFFDAEE